MLSLAAAFREKEMKKWMAFARLNFWLIVITLSIRTIRANAHEEEEEIIKLLAEFFVGAQRDIEGLAWKSCDERLALT